MIRTVAARIEGGFIGIEAGDLIGAWSTCMDGDPGAGGFRAWMACREMIARRRGESGGRYTVAELAGLLGVSIRTAAGSVRRLVAAGLIVWRDDSIEFPGVSVTENEPVTDSIGKGRGAVAIPRRLLRWLAKGARPSLIAVALGALLRCVSRRREGFTARGRFKSSWVAQVFGIADRHARDARAELIALGWLEADPADDRQWAWNRWGRAFLVHLGWQAPRDDRPTLPADPGARSSYPDLQPGSSPERRSNPEPGTPGLAGVSPEGVSYLGFIAPDHKPSLTRKTSPSLRDVRPNADRVTQDRPGQIPCIVGPRSATGVAVSCVKPLENKGERPAPSGPRIAQTQQDQLAPNLRDIKPVDLEYPARVVELHRQAVEAGWSTPSEADRLRVLAAAEHARTVGTSNPPGLFRAIVQGRRYGLLTQGDEDRAARRLREHQRPTPAPETVPDRKARISPYAQPAPSREPSALGGLLARLANGLGSNKVPESGTIWMECH